MIVTTSLRQNPALVLRAKAIAEQLNLIYLDRAKLSLNKLIARYQNVLVVYQDQLIFVQENGAELAFHPDTAMLRIKSSRDPLIELLGQPPKRILDCTMGLASDSIVMSYAGHEVTALESSLLPHFIVSQGLASYQTGHADIDQAMRRIQTYQVDALEFLKNQVEEAFDIIYFDPMFSENITESQNLSGLANLANPARLSPVLMAEATRVAAEKIILKAHFRDTAFEAFGFERLARPNQKFHFGVKDLSKKREDNS